ncbi:hypothetical protein ACG873_17155 [Mesorhizobium sp. AaZ16]|uniref:hypothetical protein n=1 Tax=Mesorhizobium sp. AaZ16 TaxID=3402289 RepID=UPI00374EF802
MITKNKAMIWLAATAILGLATFILPAMAKSDKEMNSQLDELFGQHAVYHAFFTDLKKAVSAGDRKAVAAMVDYPITVSIGGKDVKIKSGKDFVAHYDHIFSEKIVMAVEKQTYAALFANDQGIMIGDGEIWIDGICLDHDCEKQAVKIITINSDT